ncbi:histidine kinase N-terminal 7TM domain-containing protein [Halosegnis marinus]|uniref:histidine kinase N-terminal 7TM domain-containing protein n=1 Tax=Halosegnis marinus TaxID=3034023 RepID=UPI003621B148
MAGSASLAVMLGVTATRPLTASSTETLSFIGLSTGATTWAWAYALQLSATTLPAKVAYSNLLWLGIATLGASWPLFALTVAGYRHRLTPARVIPLVAVPAAAGLLVVTNPAHGLMFASTELVSGAGRVRVDATPGVGFLVFFLYSTALNVAVLAALALGTRRASGTTRVRRALVFCAGVLPFASGLVGLFTTGDAPLLDPTPLLFSLTAVITGVAVTRYRLLDSVSMVRTRVIGEFPDPVFVVDADDTVRLYNDAAARVFEVEPRAPAAAERVFAAYPAVGRRLLDRDPDAGTDHVEVEVPVRDGDRGGRRNRTFDVVRTGLSEADARVLVFRDVTDRKRAEEYTQVLNRLLRHDLRNDASIISGQLGLLEECLADGDTAGAERAIATIDKRADGLLSLSEQARAVDSMAADERETHQLGRVVSARREQLVAEYPNAVFDIDLPPEPVRVSGVSALPSALDNLIENALEHADSDRPYVSVTVTTADDRAEVRIADEGPHIPSADRDVLTGEPAALERASGLGLWLAHEIIAESGGTVSVHTREPRGNEVSLTLPLADRETKSERAVTA